MNQIIQSLFERKSVRAYEPRPIADAERDLIIDAAIQAPSAGNQALYTILEIEDQGIKDELAVVCDDQPFVAKAPLALVFLADCRRWLDCYRHAGAECRDPGQGDALLACVDAVVAAQNTVVAAQALGIGSCYIGDILENKEKVEAILGLDEYVLPVAFLVYGYPDAAQQRRPKPKRFDRDFLVQKNRYSRQGAAELRAMFEKRHAGGVFDFDEYMKAYCARKYMSPFALELTRSVRRYLENYKG